jgi:AraC-like DNA-binding protein
MRYYEYQPSPLLRPYVECFWVARSALPAPTRRREILLPDGTTQLLFSFGGGYRRFEAPDTRQGVEIAGSHLVGMRTHGVFIEQQGLEDIFAIRFRAGGLSPFITVPPAAIVQQSISLDLLFGPIADELETMIFEATTTEERIAIAERVLLRLLAAWEPRADAQRHLRRAVARIHSSRGTISIERLGRDLGLSYRTMDRAFNRYLGIPPKRLARIIRFNYALSLIHRSAGACHARTALEAGYSDQAHMIRDFREFTHTTPTDFLARRYGIVEVSQPALRNRLSNSFNT